MRLPPLTAPRAMLTVALSAALTACAASPALKPPVPTAPLTVTNTIVETRCPIELERPLPPKVVMPAGAELSGNDAGLDFTKQHFAREGVLESTLVDAKAGCPKVAPAATPG